MQTWSAWLLQALFPRQCVGCKTEGSIFCTACAQGVHIPPWEKRSIADDFSVYSRISYKQQDVQRMLHAWKYKGDREAGSWWCAWISEGHMPLALQGALFIPVPLSRRAFAERGFNQAAELAKALSKACTGHYSDVLERKDFRAQAGVSKEKRSDILLRQLYAIRKDANVLALQVAPCVVLVDDVITTGSTLRACKDVLSRVYSGKIYGASLAFGNVA